MDIRISRTWTVGELQSEASVEVNDIASTDSNIAVVLDKVGRYLKQIGDDNGKEKQGN